MFRKVLFSEGNAMVLRQWTSLSKKETIDNVHRMLIFYPKCSLNISKCSEPKLCNIYKFSEYFMGKEAFIIKQSTHMIPERKRTCLNNNDMLSNKICRTEYFKSVRTFPAASKVSYRNILQNSVILPGGIAPSARFMSSGGGRGGFSSIRNHISSLHAKKRAPKKKKQAAADTDEDWQVMAYATADEYNLDGLLEGLTQQGLYTIAAINPDAHDVLHMVATYRVGSENREIYFFREGSVVFWNVAELECKSIMLFLKKYEVGSYKPEMIDEESESLSYTYSDLPAKTRLVRHRIILNPEGATDIEKYTFSNAMAVSVKLGIWEAQLEKYIEDIEYVSEELSKTGRVVLSQDHVLQCMGQLFALRHLLNLSSDLLDTPDFYWEHEDLEQLYQKTSNYLNVSKRTSVMNVKLSHCVELMELLKSHLNEQHSARLEWIIIILIMIEVGFEVLHVLERWL